MNTDLQTRRSRLRGALLAVLGIGCALLVVSVSVAALVAAGAATSAAHDAAKVRETQLEGTPTGKKLLAAADRILSCTDTKGTCSKKNRAQTWALITQLLDSQSRAAAAATACADHAGQQTYNEIFACVLAKMPPVTGPQEDQ